MSAQTSLAIRLPAISADERATRQREVDFARGNVRHEGGILSGEIDSDMLTAAILRSETAQP
jgi:hypothetical protein